MESSTAGSNDFVKDDKQEKTLRIRSAALTDIDGIMDLVARVYPGMSTYPRAMLLGQINSFPEGHMVATLNERIIGYCATIRISGERGLSQHTWREITGGGYGSTHDPAGDYLYGYEVCVDPTMQRWRLGQRFYRERRRLCEHLRLKGIIIAGRIPGYHKHAREMGTPEDYVAAVQARKLRDQVLNFQLRNGFEPIGVLPDYLPYDKESHGYAVHLVWRNPQLVEAPSTPAIISERGTVNRVRIASVQYGQRRIQSFDDFRQQVLYFVDTTSDYGADFVVFPELFTIQLLSIANEPMRPHESIAKLTEYGEQIDAMFRELALKYNVNIVGGSTPILRDERVFNVARMYLRDGRVFAQDKIHATPNERYWWNVAGGNAVASIDTDCGPVGMLICYDVEFPELVRYLVDQGINILFVPFLTDERQSYCRVRYCAQARAVENQIYVVMSGSCGNLPNVHNNDIHYAQSCILTPCDFPFARDGVAADTTPNVEMVAIADVSLRALREARHRGTVRNLMDRRHDLYSVVWNKR
ncbi:MAG: nitrilase-related carbon-nitrogen hydrolase [Steroidobacteraceae bacterium]